ncbi:acyl carrier protein [Sedimentibacter sp. zth1]|uniref:acyl carrier protein n=1 Tax=Sedimentibacter sp. zth1 TaxID=2816908 RepID=UPI001A936EEC|nr:acyl carrier protein [Sedimentibacter sp. zth1]QSX06596.1 acyl carrier protein [Sedimentibacter sp. zth1]
MFEKVREIICEKLGVSEDKVTLHTSFKDDLDVDSLSLFELVMAFEEEFNIEIDDEQSDNIETVGNVVTYLTNLLEK